MEQSDYYVVAAVATAFAAAMAALTFWQNVRRTRKDGIREREIRARETWMKYFELAFEHPNYSLGRYNAHDELDFERYEWFVSMMLFSAEEVLILTTRDENWNAAISDQITYHKEYLTANIGKYVDHYSPEMQRLMREVLPELTEYP
jgi:hypothetical protein